MFIRIARGRESIKNVQIGPRVHHKIVNIIEKSLRMQLLAAMRRYRGIQQIIKSYRCRIFQIFECLALNLSVRDRINPRCVMELLASQKRDHNHL